MLTPQLIAAALRAAANVFDAAPAAAPAQQPAPQQYTPAQYVAPAQDGMGFQPPPQQPAPQQYAPPPAQQPAPPPPANVTAEQITNLIQPHVANDAVKAELGNAMRSMGINALPEAQPHQYPALYQAFQNVIARFTGGGAPAPQAAPSII